MKTCLTPQELTPTEWRSCQAKVETFNGIVSSKFFNGFLVAELSIIILLVFSIFIIYVVKKIK